MVKRYTLTLGAFIFLLLGYALSLLPLLLVRQVMQEERYMQALMVWAISALLLLLPAVTLIIRKIWYFQGQGPTLELDAIERKLLTVNEMDCPVRVVKKKRGLIVTWKHEDFKWCDYMSYAGMKACYELHLRFEPSTNTVNTGDRIRSIYFIVCPDEVKTGLFSRPKPLLGLDSNKQWSMDRYSDCTPMDFTFMPQEIKYPVLGTLLQNGWNIRFHYFLRAS